MIAVRAIPGAGKNFIATLLSRHYNDKTLIYYDKVFNEYFHREYLISDSNGPIKEIFWGNSKWNIVSGKEITNPIITHEHELINDDFGMVKRFNIYKQSSGRIGISPEEYSKNINESFFIFCNDKKTLDFLKKLIHIKSNGYRSIIAYSELDNSVTFEKSFNSLKLQAVTNGGKLSKPNNIITLANEQMNYKEWINVWKKFNIFLKEFPYAYSFSRFNLNYLGIWLQNNRSWDLFNKEIYLSFMKNNNCHVKNNMNANITLETELKKLFEIRDLQKQTKMILHEINYKDLFLDFKSTNTILDNYMDEIKAYTERNIRLADDYESFYGKIL